MTANLLNIDYFIPFYQRMIIYLSDIKNDETSIKNLASQIKININQSVLTNYVASEYLIDRVDSVEKHLCSNSNLLNFMGALQLLVIANFGGIDIFLETNNIFVTEEFAALSREAGFTISANYIE